MSSGQQNRRPRGRTNNNGGSSNNNSNNSSNNNRGRQQNPLARSYESSGPDVKIRGNAQHVAERYAQLARDALSAGDRVMAENYLQHAEHYNRIIAAAMLQQAQFSEQQRREWDKEGGDGESEEGDQNAASEAVSDNVQNNGQSAQLQNSEDQSAQSNNGLNNNQNNNRERNNFQNRPERPERQPRPERNSQERNTQDRITPDRTTQERSERQPRAIFVAPLDESQPIIEGTPAEFANTESEGLARTLGLGTSRVEKQLIETEVVPEASVAAADAPAQEAAPRVPRPRRAPRKTVEAAVAVESSNTMPEPASE